MPRYKVYGSGVTGQVDLTPEFSQRRTVGGPGMVWQPTRMVTKPYNPDVPMVGGPSSVSPEYRPSGATYKPSVGDNVNTIGVGRRGYGRRRYDSSSDESESDSEYGPRRPRANRRRASPWNTHVARVKRENPDLSFSQVLKLASKSY